MRKVRFKRWIPRETDRNDVFGVPKENTNMWEQGYGGEGMFHLWGVSYEEYESGPANYTVAIVELNDGTIVEVLPSKLKFEE